MEERDGTGIINRFGSYNISRVGVAMIEGFIAAYILGKVLDYATGRAVSYTGKSKLVLHFNRLVPSAPGTIAERYLQKDTSSELVAFYENELPIQVSVGQQVVQLPYTLSVAPVGSGLWEEQSIRFEVDSEMHVPDPALDIYALPIRRRAEKDPRLWDGDVVRLDGLLQEGRNSHLKFKKAKYFDAITTNYAMDHKPPGQEHSLRELLHGRTKAFGPFEGSRLLNEIGIVCMIETIDGQLVVQIRSSDVAVRPWTRSSSMSGDMDFFLDVNNLQQSDSYELSQLARAAFRETLEELGIQVERFYFLGLFREMLRGGKPEIYLYAPVGESFSQVQSAHRKHAKDHRESLELESVDFRSMSPRSGETEAYAFLREFDQRVINALGRVSGTANMTLIAGILFTAGHIHRRYRAGEK